MAKIFLSIPVLDKPEVQSMHSIMAAAQSCREHSVRLYYNENDSLISRVRNVHISEFLFNYTDYDYFMSIDCDIEVVNRYASNNIFSKLVGHNLDFVGGLYALKKPVYPVQCSSIPMDRRTQIPFDSGVIEMLWLSTGCWCLKREAIQKMADAYPELLYDGDDNAAYKKVYAFYKPDIFELEQDGQKFRKYLSEDWSMCHRWRKIGGKIFADTSIVLKHYGKIPFALWNVKVQAHSLDVNAIPKDDEDLPSAGFDLNGDKA